MFLLGGRFPGTTDREALAAATSYGVAAEQAGFAAVWMAEHHFISYGVCPSATTFAAHLLGRTRRIAVGTAACILSNRHPVALAEEAVLLDELSGGRFRLGVGRGGPWVDLEVFGTGLDRYRDGFAESLDLLRAWLCGSGTVGAAGEYFAFREVTVVPRPVRDIGLWVAATSESTVDLAAARGLPLLLGMHAGDDAKAALLARYAAGASAAGHDPEQVPHAAAYLAYVADTRAEAVSAIRGAMPGWLAAGVGGYVRIDGSSPPRRDHRAYVERLLTTGAVGTPGHCVDRLAESAATTGLRHLLLMVEGAGDPALTRTNIARLGAEVVPVLAANGAPPQQSTVEVPLATG